MGTLADSMFSVLMSWVRALVSGIWALFSSENTTVLEFLGKNWMMIAVVIIAAGLVMDWLVWLIRWQPYHIWAQRIRRLLHIEEEDDEGEEAELRAHAAMPPDRGTERMRRVREEEHAAWDEFEEYETENDLFIDEQDAQDAMERAEGVPDEELGAYPGMKYGTAAHAAPTQGTQRYSALTTEGPGSAEVARRRAEIDAWQRQIQEEARQRAQAEQAKRERLAREAEQAEQERLAREAEQAERERLAREEAERAEQERLAREEYARQMAEYEIQKAQYERELAEYERQKAEYDAQMAQIEALQAEEFASVEAAQEIAPRETKARRRRAAAQRYSDYVDGETVTELPEPPAWPGADVRAQEPKRAKHAAAKTKKEKRNAENGIISRMAKMIEPEENEIASLTALPPRVDMHEAYMPAKKPQKPGRRRT